jgi:tRNA-binding EMAP/Myf-like protein
VPQGKIVDAWAHPESDKLWCERIDIGEAEPREIASGLRAFYTLEEMHGARVVVVANLKDRKVLKLKARMLQPGQVFAARTHAHAPLTHARLHSRLVRPRQMAGFRSQGMVLCAANAAHDVVKFVAPPAGAPVGALVTFEGLPAAPASPSQVQKKKVFELVAPSLVTGAGGVCLCGDRPFTVEGFGTCTAPVAEGLSIS